MNHRLLARNVPPPGSPERAALIAALAEAFPETAEELEARLGGPTPWIVDLATPDEARRLQAWIEATSPVRVSVAPSVGAAVGSRAAAIAWLESRLGERRAPVPADPIAEHRRRHEEARARARALAAERRGAIDPDAGEAASAGRPASLRPRRTPSVDHGPRPVPPPPDGPRERIGWFGLGLTLLGAVTLAALLAVRCQGQSGDGFGALARPGAIAGPP